MTEDEYVVATNLAKLRVMEGIARSMRVTEFWDATDVRYLREDVEAAVAKHERANKEVLEKAAENKRQNDDFRGYLLSK